MSKISVCFDRVALPFLYSVIVIMWTKSRRCWFVIFVFVACSLVEIWQRLLTIKVYITMCLITCRYLKVVVTQTMNFLEDLVVRRTENHHLK